MRYCGRCQTGDWHPAARACPFTDCELRGSTSLAANDAGSDISPAPASNDQPQRHARELAEAAA